MTLTFGCEYGNVPHLHTGVPLQHFHHPAHLYRTLQFHVRGMTCDWLHAAQMGRAQDSELNAEKDIKYSTAEGAIQLLLRCVTSLATKACAAEGTVQRTHIHCAKAVVPPGGLQGSVLVLHGALRPHICAWQAPASLVVRPSLYTPVQQQLPWQAR